MKYNNIAVLSLAFALVLCHFASVQSVAVESRFRSRQTNNDAATNSSDNNNGTNVNNSDIYNGSDNNNKRFQLCPVPTGSNINIDEALNNVTAGLGNDITGDSAGFNGNYAVGIANSLGAAGTAINNGFANIGASITDAAADIYNGAVDVVKGAGNKIADAAYHIGNFFSSGSTVSSTKNSNNPTNTNNIEGATERLRANISEILLSKTTWSQADTDYNDIIVNLRAILYLNQQEIGSDVKIDSKDIDISDKSQCTFITGGAYPSNSQGCVNGFNVIQPYLVNFGLAAAKNDTIAALYWVLQILPGMADLSDACLDTGFTFVVRSFDNDDCASEIEDLATLIGDLQNGNYFSSSTQQLRNRYIITRHIPRIVGYCLGTKN